MSNVFGGIPPAVPMSPSVAVRSLNSAFQISTTRPAFVVYSVRITVTASIVAGQNGDVVLETADDAGFTQNVETISIAGNGQTYSLAVALQGVQPNTILLAGLVWTGKFVRLRTVDNTGSPAYTYRAGAEILM